VLHEDLFVQAEALAKLDAKKPKQVNLRRAVSSAYYAVFHYLVNETCQLQFGTQHAQRPYRNVLARAFAHPVMKAACASFGGGTLKDAVTKGLPRDASGRYPVLKAIREIAATFVELQEKRHLADYDRSELFKRSETLLLIENAKDRVDAFSALPSSDDKKFFLACLWAWKELTNR
jgi:uncharacterized protein (UPF0332 family)